MRISNTKKASTMDPAIVERTLLFSLSSRGDRLRQIQESARRGDEQQHDQEQPKRGRLQQAAKRGVPSRKGQ